MDKYWLKILLSAMIVFLAARLGLQVASLEDKVSLMWPAMGLSIAILLLEGKKLWPAIGLGIFGATFSVGMGVLSSLGTTVANVSGAYLATGLINHWKIDYQLHRVSDVLKFLLVVMVIAPLLSSLIGTSSSCLSAGCSLGSFFNMGWRWWLGNGMGALVITPLVLSWATRLSLVPEKPMRIVLGFSLLVITNLLLFGVIDTGMIDLQKYPLQYLSFPFLIWSGFSLKQRGATTAIFITVIIAVLGTLNGTSPFTQSESVQESLLLLCLFIIFVSIPTLLLSAAVAERQLVEEHLEYLAYHDSLTGLANRDALFEKIDNFLAHCPTSGNHQQAWAVLYVDLIRFKEINDSFGHTLGDELFAQVAQRIEQAVPSQYLVARLGGNEFAIFLPNCHQSTDPALISEEILKQLQVPFYIENCKFLIGATIGIALGNCHYEKAQDLVRDADIAMYQAKTKQKKYCQFTPDMRQKLISQISLDQELQEVIANEELSLVYQPIINLSTGEIAGFETLVRWHRRGRGSVSPAHFIPLAEQTELIIDIGEWVLNQACIQLQQWQQEFTANPFTLSVNVSPKQLRDGNLVQQIEAIIEYYDVDPSSLKLEITETAVLEENSRKILADLKAIGVGLYLDDFGMGESSLSRLYQLPLDVIKIDKAFVGGIPGNKRKSAIAQTIINLAHSMDLVVVAEGIETKVQQQQLSQWSCEMGQGFLFSKPLSIEAATQLINESKPHQD